MKKILTLFALLIAFAVNGFADNWYVVGNLTSWTPQPGTDNVAAMTLVTGTTDTYYADFTPAIGDNYFCIADGDGVGDDDDAKWADFNDNHRYSGAEANQVVTGGCYSVALDKNGERNLFINADGNTTYRLIFVASTKKLTVTKVGLEYFVAGSFTPNGGEEEAGFFGEKWNTSNNKLTLQDDGTYAIAFENVEITAAGTVAYKITNSDWSSCSADNLYKYFAQTGTYDITFTFYIDNIDGPVCTAVKKDIPGTAIWTSETAVGAGNIIISAETCAGLKVGDVLHLVVEGVTPAGLWDSQIYFEDGAGTSLDENKGIGDGGYYDMPLVITGDMLPLIKKNGVKFAGWGYSSRKVTKESQLYTGSENSVWVGNKTLTWSQVVVNKAHFVNADVKAGYTLKLIYEGNTTNIQTKYGDWTDFGSPTYTNGSATLELTADDATALKEKGFLINATGITMKQIEVLEPTTSEVQLAFDAFDVTENVIFLSSTKFDKYADNLPVKITVSNNTDPYASRNGWGMGYLRDINKSETNQIALTAGDGAEFDVILTVGDLKTVAKNGTDAYIPSQDYPEGGVSIKLWDDYTLQSVSVIVPEESDYYLVMSDGTNWTVGGKMTASAGVYTATISDWAGKYFAIAPTKALNSTLDAIEKWSRIVRPVTQGSDWLVEFVDYKGIVENNENGKVWKVDAVNTADVVFTYTPQYGSFTITNVTALQITTAGWATYSNAKAYQIAGANVYTVTGVANGEVTLNQLADGAKIPGGTGILLEGTEGTSVNVTITPSDGSATIGTNWLVGSNDYTYDITGQFSDTEKYTAYVLKKLNDKVGFYKLASYSEDNVLDPHKAFLAVPTTSGSAPEFVLIGGGDGTTGIGNVNVNLNDNTIYDLSGRRVENPTKGIYIVNGKKIVVK